jgi:hypothetical protein
MLLNCQWHKPWCCCILKLGLNEKHQPKRHWNHSHLIYERCKVQAFDFDTRKTLVSFQKHEGFLQIDFFLLHKQTIYQSFYNKTSCNIYIYIYIYLDEIEYSSNIQAQLLQQLQTFRNNINTLKKYTTKVNILSIISLISTTYWLILRTSLQTSQIKILTMVHFSICNEHTHMHIGTYRW